MFGMKLRMKARRPQHGRPRTAEEARGRAGRELDRQVLVHLPRHAAHAIDLGGAVEDVRQLPAEAAHLEEHEHDDQQDDGDARENAGEALREVAREADQRRRRVQLRDLLLGYAVPHEAAGHLAHDHVEP
jgi:hypothetical protein